MDDTCKRKYCVEPALLAKEFPVQLCDSHADELILRAAGLIRREKQKKSASGLRQEAVVKVICVEYGIGSSYHPGSALFSKIRIEQCNQSVQSVVKEKV